MSILLDLAKILHVDVESLTGRPWQYAPNGGSTVADLDEVRKYFARYDHLLGEVLEPTIDSFALRSLASDAHRRYHAAEYESVVTDLPEILRAADSLHRSVGLKGRREMLLSYVTTYSMAARVLTKLGSADLAQLAADRCANAALEADSLEAQGVAAYQVICALLRADRPEDAENLAVRMATRISRHAQSDDPSLVSVTGALWLISAVIAGRRTDRGEAYRRLDHAERMADLLGHDANFAWTAFGPTNVAIHRVSVAAELGDAGEALQLAAAVNPDALPAGLNSRRAQVYLDLAWAQAQRKRDSEAILYLLEGERVAPSAIRYNVVVREMVREMLTRSKRSKSTALHDLAVRSGVLD